MKSALLRSYSEKSTLQRSYKLIRYLIKFSNRKLWISKLLPTMLGPWPNMNYKKGWCKRNLKPCKQETSRCERKFWALKPNRPLLRTRRRTLTSKIPQRSRDSSKTKIVFNIRQSLWLKISTVRYLKYINVKWSRWTRTLLEKLLRHRLKSVDVNVTSKELQAICKTWNEKWTSTRSTSWSWSS